MNTKKKEYVVKLEVEATSREEILDLIEKVVEDERTLSFEITRNYEAGN